MRYCQVCFENERTCDCQHTVREAALMWAGDDAMCTDSQVSKWPAAARRTIKMLVSELEYSDNLVSRLRQDVNDSKQDSTREYNDGLEVAADVCDSMKNSLADKCARKIRRLKV